MMLVVLCRMTPLSSDPKRAPPLQLNEDAMSAVQPSGSVSLRSVRANAVNEVR